MTEGVREEVVVEVELVVTDGVVLDIVVSRLPGVPGYGK